MFNRRSRFSWSLPAILNTWRSSSNQTAPQSVHNKNNIEESLRNDYSFPLPLADKEATLKDREYDSITGMLQNINEHPTIYETEENDELGESKNTSKYALRPEAKSKADLCSVPNCEDDDKTDNKSKLCITPNNDNDKVTQTVKQQQINVKLVSKPNVTASYSNPVDYKWNNGSTRDSSANNMLTADQKHLSPIYIEIDDINDDNGDLYSIPIDSIRDSEKTSENNKHIHSPRSKQPVKIATSVPIITDTMRSSYKPQGLTSNRNSIHDCNDDDDDDNTYSVPIDDINSNTFSCDNVDHTVYTSPVNSPVALNFDNPSYKRVQASDPSVTEYTDPITTLNKTNDHSKDDPFGNAVANMLLSAKKHKHRPDKPTPYKPKGALTGPRQEDPPVYEEMFQAAATLPHNNGDVPRRNRLPASLNKARKTVKSRELFTPLGLDDYTMPGTDKIKLQKNPSYEGFCDTTETSSDYTYVPNDRVIIPGVLEDACTTYTEC